jgi:hypothetical protein
MKLQSRKMSLTLKTFHKVHYCMSSMTVFESHNQTLKDDVILLQKSTLIVLECDNDCHSPHAYDFVKHDIVAQNCTFRAL